jgi:CMP-2-keto-3-deoxyoctulosonic acid synthetase
MNSTKRHESYRTFGAYKSFAEADAELRAYWQSRTPQERMEALEELRVLNYGEETINARIPRVFGVPEPRRS